MDGQGAPAADAGTSLPAALSRVARKSFPLSLLSIYVSRRALGLVLFGRCIHRLVVAISAPDTRFQILPASTFDTFVFSAPELLLGVLALTLALGHQQRIVLVGTWLTALILFSPDQGALSYGLKILQGCLFWSMFLPTFSRHDDPSALQSQQVVSLASAGFLIQLSLVYHSGGLTKAEGCWLHDATALSYVLNSPLADLGRFAFLLEYPELLKLASRLVLFFEIATPIFLLSPVFPGVTRTIVAVFMIGMHLGIAVLMQIGPFPYLCIAIWLAVTPHWWWAWLVTSERRGELPHFVPAFGSRRQLLLSIPLLYVIAANVIVDVHETVRPVGSLYTSVRRVGIATGLDQHWIFFNDPCRGIPEAPSNARAGS